MNANSQHSNYGRQLFCFNNNQSDACDLNAINTPSSSSLSESSEAAHMMESVGEDGTAGTAGPPEIATVYSLINSLYSNDPNCESKEIASKWLENLQHSIYAWKISDQLLMNHSDLASCYFAANTLRNKIQHCFHELPAESYSSLIDSIVTHLKNIPENAVQTQLCLAVTYLAILVQTWNNPVEELATKVSDSGVMVEILICLAEEVERNRNSAIKVDFRRRQFLNDYMNQIAPNVMTLLTNTLREAKLNAVHNPQNAEKLTSKVYHCFGSWLPMMNNSKNEEMALLEPILNAVFESLMDNECPTLIHDTATDTICSVAILCEEYERYQLLAHYMLTHIYLLEPAYHNSVGNEDFGKSENYTRMFTELAESIVDPIIVAEGDHNRLLHLLLNCVGHFDNEIAEITFHFWYRLSEIIFKKKLNTFNAVCMRLLASLTRHCECDNDLDGLLDSRSDLYDFRCRVKDLVKEVIATVSAKQYIMQVLESIKSCTNWELIESNLFIISCVVTEREVEEDDKLVAILVNYLMSFTPTASSHIQMCATSCVILRELADWFKLHSFNLDSVLNYLLNMIASGHKHEDLSSIAASALQAIVESCASKHLMGNSNLVAILIQICCQLDMIKNEDAAINLLQCCSSIISTTQQNQDSLVAQLLCPNLSKLQEIINAKSYSICPVYYDRIAAIFRKLRLNESSLRSTTLMAIVNEQLWPLASVTITENAASNPQLIERVCRCLRFIIRCLKPDWLLKPIAEQIVEVYQQYPKHSSFLYLGSILVDEFGNAQDSSVISGLIQMLNAFSMTTFHLLTNSQLRLHPETIDDFFRLCTRILQKCPEGFLNSSMLDNIINLTLASVQLDHREANSSVVKFITELIDTRETENSVDKLLRERIGQRLVDAVVNASFFHLPTYFVPDMADIVWLLIQWDRQTFKVWLEIALKNVSAQNSGKIMSASNEQLEEFYKNVIKAENPKIVATSMRYLARLYR